MHSIAYMSLGIALVKFAIIVGALITMAAVPVVVQMHFTARFSRNRSKRKLALLTTMLRETEAKLHLATEVATANFLRM